MPRHPGEDDLRPEEFQAYRELELEFETQRNKMTIEYEREKATLRAQFDAEWNRVIGKMRLDKLREQKKQQG